MNRTRIVFVALLLTGVAIPGCKSVTDPHLPNSAPAVSQGADPESGTQDPE